MDDDSISDLSSELSSLGSLSPPPLDYPSPVSSQDPEIAATAALGCPKRPLDDADLPPVKKRKRAEPKPRTTAYLDLSASHSQSLEAQKMQIETLLKVLRKRRKIVVVAGAGMSVSAGIPDFRSSTGLFTTLRSEHKLKASGKHLFDASVYQTDSSTSSFHDMVRSLSHLVSAAKPTPFHQMLSNLAAEGRLMRLYTQNVDGIDVALPSLETRVPLGQKGPWPRTVQLHGGLEKMVCSKCNHLSNFEAALFDGPEAPLCTVCIETDKVRTDHAGKRSHGIGRLRPRIVLYNEHNPDEEAIGAVVGSDLRARPDAVIVVGTSMKIPGVRRIVKEMCGVVRSRKDGLTVWINQDPPPPGKDFEDCWDLVVKGACDEVARQWVNEGETSTSCTESEAERAKERSGPVQVIVNAPHKKAALTEGMLTPSASPPSKPLKLPKIRLKLKAPTLLSSTHTAQNNPASKGTPIAQILKKATKSSRPSSAKAASKAKAGSKAKSSTASKITTTFKLAKGVRQPEAKQQQQQQQQQQQKPAAPRSCEYKDLTRPVTPIPREHAHSDINGPLHIPVKSLFSFQLSTPTVVVPAHDTNGGRRRSDEIVSPTGSIPKDMAKLLN